MARVHVERVGCLFALVLYFWLFFSFFFLSLYFIVVRYSRIVDRVECRSLQMRFADAETRRSSLETVCLSLSISREKFRNKPTPERKKGECQVAGWQGRLNV